MKEPLNWHRLFGLSWEDFFYGLPVKVEVEKDLSLKQQYLDVVIIRLERDPLTIELPDGFDVLASHNLISFKSFQETLDGWAFSELVGHYVNYRKQVSPNMRDLLPEADFRLFIVCARFPQNLAGQVVMAEVSEGVYDVGHFSGTIRMIVVGQLPCERHNAMLCLFSAKDEQRNYGARIYQPRSPDRTSFLVQLFRGFPKEFFPVPYSMADLVRETRAEVFATASVEERLEGIPVEKRLEGIPAEKRLEGIPVEQRLAGVPPEEYLKTLSPEALQALRQLLADKAPPS